MRHEANATLAATLALFVLTGAGPAASQPPDAAPEQAEQQAPEAAAPESVPVPDRREKILPFLVCEDGLEEACDLFREGRFEEAAQRFAERARAGDYRAQNNLGVLFETGVGVTKDKTQALRWYAPAAEQGLAMAQYNLAVLLATDHVLGTAPDPSTRREDLVRAYMWLIVAAHQGHEVAERTRRDLVLRMTPDEVGDARERARRRITDLEKNR